MYRKFIPVAALYIYDEMHQLQPDGSFKVDEAKDGQTTEQHRAGIEYIKQVLRNGQKIMPILALENDDGTYTRLDGFKRAIAQVEEGYKFIEAFVCSPKEYEGAVEVPFGNHKMRAWKGGQEKEHHSLFEGGEKPDFDYENLHFLYKSPNHFGLRVEISECIHVHWGDYGKYRLALGRRDFEALADAVSKIDG